MSFKSGCRITFVFSGADLPPSGIMVEVGFKNLHASVLLSVIQFVHEDRFSRSTFSLTINRRSRYYVSLVPVITTSTKTKISLIDFTS